LTKDSNRGFTLIELMIAITLVSALSVGMLLAMRTALLTLEKVNGKLEFDRRVMGASQIATRQIGGVMPVSTDCGGARIVMFRGNEDSLRLVTSYSIERGARGMAQFVEFQVVRGQQGLRLIVNEHPFGGPSTTESFCTGDQFAPVKESPSSFIIADKLATCRFAYREAIPDQPLTANWMGGWDRPWLPAAVRIEMTPLDGASTLPVMNVNVPIRITRQIRDFYEDFQ
jgi:prepilin-type N-terminal cleavage/methylation domain-containing protein